MQLVDVVAVEVAAGFDCLDHEWAPARRGPTFCAQNGVSVGPFRRFYYLGWLGVRVKRVSKAAHLELALGCMRRSAWLLAANKDAASASPGMHGMLCSSVFTPRSGFLTKQPRHGTVLSTAQRILGCLV